MLIIYGTDAPINHYPITTVTMIVVNIAVHTLIVLTGYDMMPWILAFGDGLHPIQWLTHNFLHINWLHLIGNMLFLWPFGLVVEGKLGWFRMLIFYLLIGSGQGMCQQVIMLAKDPIGDAEHLTAIFDNPNSPLDDATRKRVREQFRRDLLAKGFGALGASSVIFGLLAACAIWAPVNEFSVYVRLWLTIGGLYEWPILTVSGIFFFKEFFVLLIMGMPMSSEALHLLGFVVGGTVALVYLYNGFVDCEGFDLISHWSGEKFTPKRIVQRARRERDAEVGAAKPKGPPRAVVPQLSPIASKPLPVAPATAPSAINLPTAVPGNRGATFPLVDLTADPMLPPIEPQPLCALASISAGIESVDEVEVVEAIDECVVVDIDEDLTALDSIESAIERQDFKRALRELVVRRKVNPGFIVSPATLGRLAEGLLSRGDSKPAVSLLLIGAQSYHEHAARWRIRAAQVELAIHQNAVKALECLKRIDRQTLTPETREHFDKVSKIARQQIDSA